ncbi:hypothetical protein N1027_00075 [Herbiconiux sp. CPCC 205763]|uniref:Bacitracin resistance protein n=1 Tax=Herbiconiux aconitum TaxID=2970913 RepID=A0ABT2GJX9_9MICO|nr:hypothetical protein [Herbiconiux aconitum]MCS5716529.1 hypothetical protein [Herbiconiux aconitum]
MTDATASVASGSTPPNPPTPAKPAKRGFRTFGRAGWAVAVVFAFLYAYHLWGGIANLVGVVTTFSSFGVAVSAEIWTLVIVYAVVPILVYAIALVVGRTLSNGARAVVFAVGFAVVSVVSLDILVIASAA